MKIIVQIATYNEKENIQKLIPILAGEFKTMPYHEFHILIVDGNSPDGTGSAVEELIKQYSFVHLLREKEKRGLGAAHIYGFKHAMKELAADVIIEMDADFQHDPKDVVRLVKEIDNGYDYVIGSRFTKGGSIPKEWELYRKFLSWGGNIFTRVVLGIFNITDFTTGFKAARVKGFVDQIDLDSILSSGFAYKMDLLYITHKLGAKIKEIPIVFGIRDRGESKMERRNFMDSLKVVLTIRYRESQSFFRFIAVGFAGLGTDLFLFNIFRVTIFSSDYASAGSGFLAMVVTFALNNFWSFHDRKKTEFAEILKSFPFYAVMSYIPIIFRSWLIGFSTAKLGDTFLVSNGAFFIGVALGLIWNFTVYSKIIWRKGKND